MFPSERSQRMSATLALAGLAAVGVAAVGAHHVGFAAGVQHAAQAEVPLAYEAGVEDTMIRHATNTLMTAPSGTSCGASVLVKNSIPADWCDSPAQLKSQNESTDSLAHKRAEACRQFESVIEEARLRCKP